MTKASSWVSRMWSERRGFGIAAKARRCRAIRTRRVFFEPLEDRRVLATIMVTSLDDNMIVDGQVTLREALEAANTNTSIDGSEAGGSPGPFGIGSDDEIVFQAGLTGTIHLNGTDLTVNDARLKITGPGREFLAIDAQQNSRHFHVGSRGLSLDGITLTGGLAGANGGAILIGNGASITVQNSTIRDNSAVDGGAIYVAGGSFGSTVVIENSTIQNNSAVNGGGIFGGSGYTISLKSSTVSGNQASGSGGGIYSKGPSVITDSTISGNLAALGGGGIQGIDVLGHVNLQNSTVSGNEAGSTGGGVGVESGSVNVHWSTVVENRVTGPAGKGGGIYVIPSTGLPNGDYAPLRLQSSILAQNSAAMGPDLTAPEIVEGVSHSLIGNNAGTFFAAAPVGAPTFNGNLIGEPGALIDPLLAPLGNYGGPTETHALLSASPAIDASYEPTIAVLIGAPTNDQRGFPRLENHMDMGAFELTQPLNFYDDGTIALWANNPLGFVESPVPVFHNGAAIGTEPYQVVELFQLAPGTSSYPLVFVDLVGNTFSRLAYMRPDGAALNFGTSTVGSASFRTNDQVFHYVPTVTGADVTTGGTNRYQSVVTANFGGLANVTSTKSFLTPVVGRSSSTVGVEFEALQDITLATGAAFTNNDRLRLFTASSMFNDETHFDADVLRYEDANGNIQTLVLKDITPTNAYLFPSAVEIGSWFELVKTGGSTWFPDSPTIRVTIDDKHGLRLGLQGYLLQSDDNNDDSLSVWLEWLDAPNTVTAGTMLNLDVTVTATPPGTPGIVVSETDGNTAVSEAGTTDTFTVALAAQPRSNVVIGVSGNNTNEATISPAMLTFTPANWDQPQTFTVTGIPDLQIDADQLSTITLQVDQDASATEYLAVANRTVSVTTTNIDEPESPTITWNAPADITYGTLLDETQLNATASVPGIFVYAPASGTRLDAGLARQLSVTFTPEDAIHYQQVTAFVSINLLKADATITWSNPADITFGDVLGAAQLNATASVPGTFVYTPASGVPLNAGSGQSISVVFTPNDTTNYNSATGSVAINVQKAGPVVTWSNPAAITYGTLLDDTPLNATANTPGLFVYSPASGTQLNAGENQTLSVHFTPTDTSNYNEATASVTVDVLKADPVITWNDPDDIPFGTTLGDGELDATADVAGTFSYAPARGTQLAAGPDQRLSVIFFPTDTANYNSVNADVSINVTKAIPEISWSTPVGIEFGTLLSEAQLNATTLIAGSFVYSPAAGTRLDAGADQTLQVTFTPMDSVSYESVTKSVTINVTQAESFITWDVPADITVGTLLGNAQLNAMGDRAGSYVYAPALGTELSAGNAQQLRVTFTPDDANYASATTIRLINVLKVDPVVTWNQPADIRFGTLLGDTQLNAVANIPGSFVYTPASGTQLNAGANQQLSATFTPTDAGNFNTVTINVTVTVLASNLDFGDAPSAYPVTLAQDGARHAIGSLFLGSVVDAEADGQPTSDATGDDNDEDGVFLSASIIATSGSATKSSFSITASGTAKLDAWIDFNQDGDWSDAGEQVFTNRDVAAGVSLLSFNVPVGARPGATAARFRLSSAGGLAPTGAAADGEVEDYIVTILDADTTGGAAVEIDSREPGTLDVVADGNDVVVRRGAIELFRAPGAKLKRLDIAGTGGDDMLNLANLDAIFAGLVAGDSGAGNDTLRLTGSGQSLDLTQLADSNIQGLETIDITGGGDNSLTLDVNAVLQLSSTTDTLRVVYNDGDTVIYKTGWLVDLPQIVGNQFVHILKQAGAIVEVVNPTPFRNPLRPLDANRDGDISPLDALVIINRLNSVGPGPLEAPVSATVLSEFFYTDINGDRSISPLDALLVINFLNASAGEGEAAFAGVCLDLVVPASRSSIAIDALPVRRQQRSAPLSRDTPIVVSPPLAPEKPTTAMLHAGSTRPTRVVEESLPAVVVDEFIASFKLELGTNERSATR